MNWLHCSQWATVATALAAAVLWGLAATVKIPGVPWGGSGGDYDKALLKSSRLNRAAAAMTGISAFFQAIATYLAM